MSRRYVLLILIFLILAGILTVIQELESRRTPGWQSELERYLQLSGRSLAKVRIIAAVEAAHPQNLTSDLLIAVPTDWTWQGISEIPPPTTVECVRLESQESSQAIIEGQRGWEVVLIGFHDDGLWRAGWMVHEIYGVVDVQDLQDLLAWLGCNVGLDNQQATGGVLELHAIGN